MDIEKMVTANCSCEAHKKYWDLWLMNRQQLQLFGLPSVEEDFLAWAAVVGAARRLSWCRAMRDVTWAASRGT